VCVMRMGLLRSGQRWRLGPHGQQRPQINARRADQGAEGVHLHPGLQCLIKQTGVGGVDKIRRGKARAVGPLHQIEHGRPLAAGHNIHKFAQVFLPALAGRIRKARGIVLDHGDVFALDPQGRQAGAGEQAVQTALAAFGLARKCGVALRKGQTASVKGRLKHAVGRTGVYPHPKAASAGRRRGLRHGPVGQPHAFLRIFELAGGVAGRGCEHRRARQAQPKHAARIVAVHPQVCALVLQKHAEAFAALHKGRSNAAGRQGQQRGWRGCGGRGKTRMFAVRAHLHPGMKLLKTASL